MFSVYCSFNNNRFINNWKNKWIIFWIQKWWTDLFTLKMMNGGYKSYNLSKEKRKIFQLRAKAARVKNFRHYECYKQLANWTRKQWRVFYSYFSVKNGHICQIFYIFCIVSLAVSSNIQMFIEHKSMHNIKIIFIIIYFCS